MAFPLNVAIVSALRSPVGRAVKGSLKNTRPDDMVAEVMNAALAQAKGLEAKDIDDVILGCAMPEAEQGLNIARNAVFVAGWPDSVPGETINRFCSSGLQAITHAAMNIHAGLSDVILAGGVESMSMVPMGGHKTSLNPELMQRYPEAYIAMGHTAERVAQRFEVTREQQDAFAARSHDNALAAISKGYFKDEITAIKARTIKGGEVGSFIFDTDECPRPGTTAEGLAKLRPAFAAKGTATAGNSSPLSDGAAATVMMSDAKMNDLGLIPLGRFRDFAVVGLAPDIMGIGPVPAIQKLLKRNGLTMEDISLVEINEAFAAQSVYCQRELGIPDEKLNISGGAVALGHPLGCTGTKLAATLLHGLKRTGGKYGIVSMCIGGGMGAAGLFEVA